MSQTSETRSGVVAECHDCDWKWPVPTGKIGRPKGSAGSPIVRCKEAITEHVDHTKHCVTLRLTTEQEFQP